MSGIMSDVKETFLYLKEMDRNRVNQQTKKMNDIILYKYRKKHRIECISKSENKLEALLKTIKKSQC